MKNKTPLEHVEQVALIKRARLNRGKWPQLKRLISIPNGARTSMSIAKKLKAEGMVKGVSDLFLACPDPKNKFNGLWIELKRLKGGRTSKEQKEWILDSRRYGYAAFVAEGTDKAFEIIEHYLKGEIK